MPTIEWEPLQISGGSAVWVAPETPQSLSPEVLEAAMAWFVETTGTPATALVVNVVDAPYVSGLVFNYLKWEAFYVREVPSLPTGAWIMLSETGGVISGGA